MEKAQVLIVEDDAIIALDLESRMKQLGYGVTGVAGYGEQAIEKAKENMPDVVLMDIILKGEIDGIEAAEEIRTQYDIPVIFITGYADKERLKRAKLAYPFGFIIKPFSDKDLEITIEMALYVAKVDSERKQAEEQLARKNNVLDSINKVFRDALTCETEEDLAKTCLSVAEKLTGSKFGFFGELNQDGLFDTLAISNPGWDKCKLPIARATIAIRNMPVSGVDRATMREGKSRIINGIDAIAKHPDHVKIPEGHPPITAFLGVPFRQRGKTIGMIGLGNKEGGYCLEDQENIEALSLAMIEALRSKRAEEALRQAQDELEHRVEERTAELAKANEQLKQEIEERKQVEQELRLHYEVVKNMAEGVVLVRVSDEVIVYANRKFEEMLGYGPGELNDKPVIVINYEDENKNAQLVADDIIEQLARYGEASYEVHNVKKDGTSVWCQVHTSTFEHSEYGVVWIAVHSDITEQKQAENALRESEKKFRNLYEGSRDA